MSHNAEQDCAWCALPKAKQGIVVGIVGAVLVHVAIFAAITQLGTSPAPKTKRVVQMIDMGTMTIHAPVKRPPVNDPKEI